MSESSSVPVISGCEPWSHIAAAADAPGALIIHGFTGAPASMRSLAEAFAAAGFHVELPRLPGHGTSLADMKSTSWADWIGEAEAAYQRVAARSNKIVVAGLSMGGALTLRLGADHPEIAGLVCVNPATQPSPDLVAAVSAMIDSGTDEIPGIGNDIADPDETEVAYTMVPLRPLLSFFVDGLTPLVDTYPTSLPPLLLMNSPQDHVVEPAQAEFLAGAYGATVERVMLERSFHVATQDYDREMIEERAVQFARRVTS